MDTPFNQTLDTSAPSSVRDFLALLKPKVMSLVIFSGVTGMVLAPGVYTTHPFLIGVATLCLALGAGAAGAINMWYDRDIDAIMNRTKQRPIPAGRVNADEALTFGLILSVLSTLTMGVCLNWLAAGLLAFSIFFYTVIYTVYLKRSTPYNIVIGGAAGAFPPLIGWAAMNGDISLVSVSIFALIFFWTPPHFWALSLFMTDDYARAGIPMMPNVRGVQTTKNQMVAYTFLLLPLSLAPTFLGACGIIYGAAAAVLSLIFIASALCVRAHTDIKHARAMFGFSIIYLFVLLALMMIDKV